MTLIGNTSTTEIGYSVHPGLKMVQNWISNMPEKTGRSLDEWLNALENSGLSTKKDRFEWLNHEHKFGTNTAGWLARRSLGKSTEDEDPEAYLREAPLMVDAMFAGAKEHLRLIGDRLLMIGSQLGPDVRICPCNTVIPLYRKHVFAQVKPTTRTRIDLGFALKGLAATGKLIDTGGFARKNRITHRIPIASLEDIDDEVMRWMQRAYEVDV